MKLRIKERGRFFKVPTLLTVIAKLNNGYFWINIELKVLWRLSLKKKTL